MRRWAWAALLLVAIAAVAMALLSLSGYRHGAALLRRSYEAESKYSYLGVLEVELLQRPHPIHSRLNVIHAAPDNTRMDAVSPPEVAGYVVIDKGEDRYMYSPNSERWYANTRRSPDENVDLALKNYRVRVSGRDTVVGRPCRRLRITPRYPGNPRKLLWTDDQTGLVLRKELRNAEGQVISRSRYTEIRISRASTLDPDAFAPPADAQLEWDTKAPPTDFTALKPSYVPPGYRFDEVRVRVHDRRQRAHIRYTDGLNTISVFEEIAPKKAPDKASGKGGKASGRIGGLYWNAIERQVGGLRVVIMGDIAAEELRKMADSITTKENGGHPSD
jgi:negative regulator of sigma E activity